jgi:hypothetical protein
VMVGSALPDDRRTIHRWLRDPVGSVAGLSFWDRFPHRGTWASSASGSPREGDRAKRGQRADRLNQGLQGPSRPRSAALDPPGRNLTEARLVSGQRPAGRESGTGDAATAAPARAGRPVRAAARGRCMRGGR